MEDQYSPFSWEYLYSNAEGMEVLKQALLYTTLELEKTIESANEEITSREVEIIHLRNILSTAMKERDEALSKCELLIEEAPSSSSSSSSSCSLSSLSEEQEEKKRRLPEKGKLLQAVMEAGPLLQTLLPAGPLPQWQHPPPKIDYSDIPIPLLALARSGSKRVLDLEPCEGFENSPTTPKFRKIVSS